MYTFLWMLVNGGLVLFTDIFIDDPIYWIVQAIFVVGGFIVEERE